MHRGPSNQSLARLILAATRCLPDLPLRAGVPHRGTPTVSAALRRALERAEVIFSKWLNALDAQTFPRPKGGETLTVEPCTRHHCKRAKSGHTVDRARVKRLRCNQLQYLRGAVSRSAKLSRDSPTCRPPRGPVTSWQTSRRFPRLTVRAGRLGEPLWRRAISRRRSTAPRSRSTPNGTTTRTLTETNYFLECGADAQMQLDDEIIPVRPGMAIVIRPGCRHRAIGKMTVLVVCLPKFDPSDEWLD